MVAGQHKDSVLEPGLTTGCLKELTQCHIRIADALVHDDTFLWIDVFVFLRYLIGMMTRCRKDSRHKGLFHLRHLGAVILQERLIPDGPHAVKILVAIKTRVFIKVLTSIVFLEACAACEGHKAHRTTLGTMEEGRLITFCI